MTACDARIVAMALQMVGEADISTLLTELESWLAGSFLEQRAVAAGLCEPVLLNNPKIVGRVLEILDQITLNLIRTESEAGDERRILRQALGYCWSVAAAGLPEAGKKYLEKWLEIPNPDVRWILRENLTKKRLIRLDPDWTATVLARLQGN